MTSGHGIDEGADPAERGESVVVEVKWDEGTSNKAWQKAKGLTGKALGKTGLGEAIDAAHKAFDNIDWKHFDTSDNYKKPIYSSKELEDIRQIRKAKFEKDTKPLMAAFDKMRQAADNAITIMEKKPGGTKLFASGIKYARAMKALGSTFKDRYGKKTWDEFDVEWRFLRDERAKKEKAGH